MQSHQNVKNGHRKDTMRNNKYRYKTFPKHYSYYGERKLNKTSGHIDRYSSRQRNILLCLEEIWCMLRRKILYLSQGKNPYPIFYKFEIYNHTHYSGCLRFVRCWSRRLITASWPSKYLLRTPFFFYPPTCFLGGY